MKRWTNRAFWYAALALALWACWESAVFVDETELVVVTNFGELAAVYDQPGAAPSETEPRGESDRGWHWKLPWHSVRRFDRRLQVFDSPAREMVTFSGQQQAAGEVGGSQVGANLMVACYVCWRIPPSAEGGTAKTGLDARPVVQFLRTVRTPAGAELRIDKLVRSQLGAEIARLELADLLLADAGGKPSKLRDIGGQVVKALAGLKDEAGIEVVDVQIRRLNLPEGNRAAVYARQKSERQRIANKYRAEGQAEAKKIASQAQRESEAVLSQAYAQAQAIRGAGEAQAAETYAAAYGRDPEFFRLLRTLQAYEEMLGNQATLILSADSPLFRLLRDGPPADKAAASRSEPPGPAPVKPPVPGVTRKP